MARSREVIEAVSDVPGQLPGAWGAKSVTRNRPAAGSERYRWGHGTLALLLLAGISGCVSMPFQAGEPEVDLGPPLEIPNVAADLDGIRLVAIPAGDVHALIALSGQKQLLDVVLRRDGHSDRTVVAHYERLTEFDAAVDQSGTVHALINEQHWLLQGGAWVRSEKTPWAAAGIAGVQHVRLVPGAPRLIWCFEVQGKAVGAPLRLDWVEFGSGGGGGRGMGGVIPWLTRGFRTVFVSETADGYGPWVVVEPHDLGDTSVGPAAADSQGNISTVYLRSRPGVVSEFQHEIRFARIPGNLLHADSGPPGATVPASPPALTVIAFDGGTPWVHGFVDPNPAATYFYPVAVDPQSGTTLVGQSLARGGRLADVPRYPGDALVGWSTAPGGDDSFHAIGGLEKDRVQYMRFAHGAWSAPITIDDQAPSILHRTAAVVGTGQGTAVAVWRRNASLMARWIQLRVQ